MSKRALALFLILIWWLPAFSASKKGVSFNEKAALEYIKVLAGDNFLGRKSGQLGGALAENYVASKFKEWGLEPAGQQGTFFQEIEFSYFNVEEGTLLEVKAPSEKRRFYYGDDWRVVRYSGSGNFTAEIVFVGYGIKAKDFNEYSDLELKGKLLLMSADSPASKLRKKAGKAAELEERIKAAQKSGARGIIFFTSSGRIPRIRVKKELYKKDFVMLAAGKEVVDLIFKDTPTEPAYAMQQIASELKPQSFETGVKAFVAVRTTYDPKRKARNVLAKISGTDPKLREEYVIVGAHMDHLGISPLGDVMNGANDNASGTAVVMEIARELKMEGFRPKRTVIFALWAAEEQGLLGSRYYADHPLYPLEKTAVYINLDMVGQGKPEPIPLSGVYYATQAWQLLRSGLPADMIKKVEGRRGGPGGSDHTSFLLKGVPAFFIITEGKHLKYHHSRDDVDLIKPEILKRVGEFVKASVKLLASSDAPLIASRRRERFFLKYENLVNYIPLSAGQVTEKFSAVKDPLVDVQLALIEGEGIVELMERLLDVKEKIKKAKGLMLAGERESWRRKWGRMRVLLGVKNFGPFRTKPAWAKVFASQGLDFLLVEGSQIGKNDGKLIEKLTGSGLLLIVKTEDPEKINEVLEACRAPVVIISEKVPEEKTLKKLKEKNAVLGLIYKGEKPSSYLKKLNKLKEKLGFEHVCIVNSESLHQDRVQQLYLDLIAEMLKAKYDRNDLRWLFYSSFWTALNRAKGRTATMRFRPF